MKFSSMLEKRDGLALAPWLMNEPSYVSELALREYYHIYPQAVPKPKKKVPNSSEIVLAPTVRTGIELVDQVVPTELFFHQRRSVQEIMSVRTTDREALVKATLKGMDPKTGDPLAPLVYDFLLYKESNEWKIFKLIFRHSGDEQWYQYGFYATVR